MATDGHDALSGCCTYDATSSESVARVRAVARVVDDIQESVQEHAMTAHVALTSVAPSRTLRGGVYYEYIW